MPIKIIAIRHGATDKNEAGILQGQRINDPLNANGRSQAQVAAIELQQSSEPISAIYASPLLRAMQTAEIIAEALKLPVIEKSELRERDFGTLSGKTWDQIPQNTNDILKKEDKAQRYNYQPYGGENVDQVRQRLRQFLQFAKDNHANQVITVVTHNGLIRLLHDELQLSQPLHVPPGSCYTITVPIN